MPRLILQFYSQTLIDYHRPIGKNLSDKYLPPRKRTKFARVIRRIWPSYA